eukprot:4186765-Karenia_brevis.AAC.1
MGITPFWVRICHPWPFACAWLDGSSDHTQPCQTTHLPARECEGVMKEGSAHVSLGPQLLGICACVARPRTTAVSKRECEGCVRVCATPTRRRA